MATYFQLWKSDHWLVASQMYTCEICLRKKIIDKEKRICFKYDLVDEDDVIDIKLPTKNEDGVYLPSSEWEIKSCNSDEFLEVLCDFEELDPTLPAFELLMNKMVQFSDDSFREICPVGFISDDEFELLEMEGLCEVYKMAPFYPPTLDAQPPSLMQAFAVIRSEKNKFQAVQFERMKHREKK